MGWTSIDADGDGNGWVSSSNPGIYHNSGVNLSGTGHNSSEAYVISGSYANQTGQALYPNNYLVSPTKIAATNGSSISFYACAQDASYAAEHFGVAVSTTTASASEFTTIQEWTMTAKGTGAVAAGRNGQTRQGNWYLYNVDLSAYAGQDIWVAIRHFNCTDQFILNVDDIELTDGRRGNRNVQHYTVYRRAILKENELTAEDSLTLVVDNYTDTVYADLRWANMEPGLYQYGVSAVYPTIPGQGGGDEPGGGDQPGNTDFFCDFENGLTGWNVLTVNADGGEWLHSDNNPGGYDYSEHAYSGEGFAMCYSYVDYDGAYNTDSYLVTDQKYEIVDGSTLSFYADNANDDYPENFSVCVATVDNPTASDFNTIWDGGAKGTANAKAEVRHENNRYENWRSHNIDLSAYAGQSVWIAFHDVNYDAYEIWIDDVQLGVINKGNRATSDDDEQVTYNFDDNTLMGWTSIDADGDGFEWVSSSNPGLYHNSGVDLSGNGHNDSEAFVLSGSYANGTGAALTPDNYLVAPEGNYSAI
jgi:hypothetical protein